MCFSSAENTVVRFRRPCKAYLAEELEVLGPVQGNANHLRQGLLLPQPLFHSLAPKA
jgi:hypothetical protein